MQKKLFEFFLIKKTILDIHNELIKMGVWGSAHRFAFQALAFIKLGIPRLPAHHAVSPA
jgi:hypothetical protein